MVTWGDLRREPFRLLFPLGIVFGCVGVGHWLAYALGWRTSYSGFYHASLQVGAYMSCFIVGFLMTALPRFSATTPASNWELAGALGLMLAQALALWARQWVLAETLWIGLLALVAVFAGRRFARKQAGVGPPTEFVWIPIALLLGVVGAGLLMAGQLERLPPWSLRMGPPMAQQGFLLGIVLGVGGFMAPRLMGREVLLVTPTGIDPRQARWVRNRRMRLHGLASVLFAMSFWLEGLGEARLAYGLRASVVTAEFIWTARFYRPPRVRDLYVRLLWASIWMIVLGLWGAALVPRYRVAWLHVVFIGGLSLMTFAVGTMVCLSHAGPAEQLRRPLWALRIVGLGVIGALTARLAADLHPAAFFQWLGLAAIFWLVAGISWLGFTLPRVFRPLAPGALEQVHEEAKRRLLKTSVAQG